MGEIRELVPIEERNGQQAVNARHLYAWLESKRQFSDWIKEQIMRCDLIQDVDYQSFSQICEKPQGGRPTTEYALSIDAAKEISMMSQTEKGKQARRYFIECEKIAKHGNALALPKTYKEALRELLTQVEQNEQLQLENKKQSEIIVEQNNKIAADAPKVEHYDMFFSDAKDVCIRTFVNQARISGEGKFWAWLEEKGIIYRKSNGEPAPYAKYADILAFKDANNKKTGWSGQQLMVVGESKVKLAKMYYKDHPERFFEPIVKQNNQLTLWQ